MNETEISVYRMNPAEDRIVFGDELAEGMWVLNEDPLMRTPGGRGEDTQIRQQRFRRITRLRRNDRPADGGPPTLAFVGEWIDGYQEVHNHANGAAWIAKKDPITASDENYGPGDA
jgi:hypothetical protein